MVFKIAIDGPAASGKSSAAEKVAEKLGFERLDSGLLYRAVTYIAISSLGQCNPQSKDVKNLVEKLDIKMYDGGIYYNGENIKPYLRTKDIDQRVGVFAKELYIRNKIHSLQHYIISNGKNGMVVDGRDIGTVVIPDAFLKIFITAKDENRAMRRSKQTGQDYDEVLTDIRKRDEADINREHGPLKAAEDAIIIENDKLSLDETVDKIINLFKEKKEKVSK